MPTPARAIATVTISADWTQKAVEAIEQANAPILTVVKFEGKELVLRVTIDDLREWVGIGKDVPAEYEEQGQLVHRVVTDLLKPIGDLPETEIVISDLVVG